MARSILRQRLVVGGATYTVPAGKFAVFRGYYNGSSLSLSITGGINIPPPTGALPVGPVVADAGDVISATGSSGEIAITGFLYDK